MVKVFLIEDHGHCDSYIYSKNVWLNFHVYRTYKNIANELYSTEKTCRDGVKNNV